MSTFIDFNQLLACSEVMNETAFLATDDTKYLF